MKKLWKMWKKYEKCEKKYKQRVKNRNMWKKCEKKILEICDKNDIILEKFGKIKWRLQE